jgi:hypothetical protein
MRWFWVLLLSVTALCGCRDPVAEARIDSLGPEPGPYEEGPDHRPGQPCTWCHGPGGEDPIMDLAGTVFLRPGSTEPARSVVVRLFDSAGHTRSKVTGVSGNFHFEEGELGLNFPLWVRLESDGQARTMHTPIFRERACGACHGDPSSPTQAGHVFLLEDE